MSFENPNAFLPRDLLDSDDEVTQDNNAMEACIGNILDDDENSNAQTADNSSASGNNSSSENSSIFSV